MSSGMAIGGLCAKPNPLVMPLAVRRGALRCSEHPSPSATLSGPLAKAKTQADEARQRVLAAVLQNPGEMGEVVCVSEPYIFFNLL